MYIVIKKFRSDAVEKTIENARVAFLPVVSKMPGFVDYHVIRSGDDTVVSVLLFNSKEEADVSIVASRQFVKDNGVDSLYQLQELIAGEVVVKG